MSEIIPIEALYVITTEVDGKEKIMVGVDGIPFIYLSAEAVKEYEVMEKMQLWANSKGITMKLQMYKPLTTLDVIEPMPSGLSM